MSNQHQPILNRNYHQSRPHITIECDDGDATAKEHRHDATPSKSTFPSSDVSLFSVKKSILFTSNDTISRENSSDFFIQREVQQKSFYFPVDGVKFDGKFVKKA